MPPSPVHRALSGGFPPLSRRDAPLAPGCGLIQVRALQQHMHGMPLRMLAWADAASVSRRTENAEATRRGSGLVAAQGTNEIRACSSNDIEESGNDRHSSNPRACMRACRLCAG